MRIGTMNYWRKLAFLVLLVTFIMDINAQSYGVTLFGTDKYSNDEFRAKYKHQLDKMYALYNSNFQDYLAERLVFLDELRKVPQFGYVYSMLLKGYVGDFEFIIDVAEKGDMERRMNFIEKDLRKLTDVDELVAKWQEYEQLSTDIFNRGDLGSTTCPVYHCTWAFDHPDLEKYLTYFTEYVPKNQEKLVELLNHSDSASFRSSAAFLLAHAEVSAQELVDLLVPSIQDPSTSVRNNSMRVIYYVVKDDDDIRLDLDKVITALDYPRFTDRNKALVILRSLPLNNLSLEQMKKLVPILIQVLEKDTSSNASNAHRVLKKISNQTYGSDDLINWKNWASTYN